MSSWFVPTTRLDSEQLGILSEYRSNSFQNLWISGYAGSGKSVILVHLLLLEKEKNPRSRVAVVVYTHALIDLLKTGIPESYKGTPVITYHEFMRNSTSYDLILVDEIQDFPLNVVYELKNRSKKVIIAGDTNQSIYSDVCPAATTKSLLSASEKRLAYIHRISRNIRSIASYFCYDRGGFNAASMGKMVELVPRLVRAESYDQELRWLWNTAKEYANASYAPVILIPNHKAIKKFLSHLCELEGVPDSILDVAGRRDEQYFQINQEFENFGIPIQYLGNGAGSFDYGQSRSLVTVMTYHSAKGLDFKAVFIPFLTNDLIIYAGDQVKPSTLFFVALTRSREQLFLSYHSNSKHDLLRQIPDNLFHQLMAGDELKKDKSREPFDEVDDIF